MKKQLLLVLIIVLVTIACSFCYAKSFSDVPDKHWAFNYIDKLSNEGIINGFENGEFKPNETLTKAQFIKLIVCANKELTSQIKVDGSMPWYKMYVDAANNYYLLPEGYENENMDTPISRVDMAKILSRFVQFLTIYNSLTEEEQSQLVIKLSDNPNLISEEFHKIINENASAFDDLYEDVKGLDRSIQEDIITIKELEIIKGYEDGTFRPNNNVTRAEASTVIYNYTEALETIRLLTDYYKQSRELASSVTEQIKTMELQMFNGYFNQYVGKNRSGSDAYMVMILAIQSNKDSKRSIKVNVYDETKVPDNQKHTKHSDNISADARVLMSEEEEIVKRMYNSRMTTWNIFEHYDSEGYIDSIEFYLINGVLNEAQKSNEETTPKTPVAPTTPDNKLTKFTGIYTNKAGEVIKYNYENDCSNVASDLNSNIKPYFPNNNFWIYNNRYILKFVKINNNKQNDLTIDADYALVVGGDEYYFYSIDFYKLSEDKTYLKSMKRGESFDLYKSANSTYDLSEYIKDKYNTTGSLNGTYQAGEDKVEIVEINNQKLGANDAILVLWDTKYSSTTAYFRDTNNMPYVLELYIKQNNINDIKDIYTYRYYANYCNGFIIHNNGKISYFNIQMSKTEPGKVQVDKDVVVKKISNGETTISDESSFVSTWYIEVWNIDPEF